VSKPHYRPRPPYPPDWFDVAEAARAAYDWHCAVCGMQGLTPDRYEDWQTPENRPLVLEVHHLDTNPANCLPSNLQPLCRRCHRLAHAANRQKRKGVQHLPLKHTASR
jgi:hypothetical protein